MMKSKKAAPDLSQLINLVIETVNCSNKVYGHLSSIVDGLTNNKRTLDGQ